MKCNPIARHASKRYFRFGRTSLAPRRGREARAPIQGAKERPPWDRTSGCFASSYGSSSLHCCCLPLPSPSGSWSVDRADESPPSSRCRARRMPARQGQAFFYASGSYRKLEMDAGADASSPSPDAYTPRQTPVNPPFISGDRAAIGTLAGSSCHSVPSTDQAQL